MIAHIRSLLYMLSLNQDECEVYCREKRLKVYRLRGGFVRWIGFHSLMHHILIPLLWCNQYLSGKRLTIVSDCHKKSSHPIIYCPTHIGGVDIEMSFLAIQVPCWLVLGDPRELYRSIDGFLLQANGVILMDVSFKEDRIAAKAQMKDLLNKGGNLLLFPEGVQNISPNALVNPLFPGAVDLAIECNADIVPIALCRASNRYYANIGENISYEGCDHEEKYKLTEELRNKIATLKWEIIESIPGIRRRDVKEASYEEFLQEVFSLDATYTWTMDDIKSGIFRPKGVTDPDEVFDFMNRISPGLQNAFLFSKADGCSK
ncbi:MAG: hypothetical protein E7307_11400 [Butyrivibrio sp.]|nr:hypothetical protein [Butyrivibrio sp.]